MKEYDLKQVIFAYFKYKSRRKKNIIFKEFFHCFFVKYYLNYEKKNNIFMNSIDRADLNSLYESIIDSCKYPKSKCNIIRRKRLNFKNILYFFRYFLSFFCGINRYYALHKDEFLPNLRLTFKEKMYIYLRLIEQKGMYRKFIKYDFDGIDNLIVFCDAYAPESILVNIFNKLNKETITCQHAIFRPYKIIDSVHSCCTYRIYAKKILTWGEDSNEFFSKSNCECITCGNPLLNIKNNRINSKKIGIIFDIPELYKENCEMLRIILDYANENDFNISVRLHPVDIEDKYTHNNRIIYEKNLDDSYFIVGNTSSMIFTYLSQNKKVLKFNSSILYYNFPSEICFNDLDGFKRVIDKIEEIDFSYISKKQISYIGSNSYEKYNEFFNNINEKNS